MDSFMFSCRADEDSYIFDFDGVRYSLTFERSPIGLWATLVRVGGDFNIPGWDLV